MRQRRKETVAYAIMTVATDVRAILLGLLFCISSCLAQTAATTSSGKTSVTGAFLKAVPLLREKTAVPLRLPTHIPNLELETELYAIVTSADETSYAVVLGAIPDCQGQHVCSYGTFIGRTSSLVPELGDYSLPDKPGISVKLQHGLQGVFYPPSIGAYCSDSLITWVEGSYRYLIYLKCGTRANAVKAANSAIKAGSERWR